MACEKKGKASVATSADDNQPLVGPAALKRAADREAEAQKNTEPEGEEEKTKISKKSLPKHLLK